MKIETRKRKRATQKVKAKFFFGPKGECFVSAFQKVTWLSFWSFVQLFCWHLNEEKKVSREILVNKICCLQRPATEKRITIVLTTRMVVFFCSRLNFDFQ